MSTCLSKNHAEQSANTRAKQILEESRHITAADVLQVLRELFNTKTPVQQDRFGANPPGKRRSAGGSLGATVPLTKRQVALKLHTFNCQACKDIAVLLNKYREQELGITDDSDDQVRPTSIQINLNFEGDVHVDGNNLGLSHITAFGQYSLGGLLVESRGGAVQRELVVECGRGTAAQHRTPGVYEFDAIDISSGIQTFNGATHLHCAQKAEGERFSVVWFSLGANQLKRCEPHVLQSLRDMGFRPRSQKEAALVNTDTRQLMPNDSKNYPPGFLFFCRTHRPGFESTVSSKTATERLSQEWSNLNSSAEIDNHDKERFRKYWAKLESIARRPRRPRTGVKSSMESQEKEEETSAKSIQNYFMPAPDSPPKKAEAIIVEEEIEEYDEADEADSNSMDKEAFFTLAEHVLEEFPQALDGTDEGFDLLLHLLQMFGFEGEESRSKAYEVIESKKQERSDNAMAQRIHRNEQLGRPPSFESQITIDESQTPDKSQIVVDDDTQTPDDKSPPTKKFRLAEVGLPACKGKERNLASSSCSAQPAQGLYPSTETFKTVEDDPPPSHQLQVGAACSMQVEPVEQPSVTKANTVEDDEYVSSSLRSRCEAVTVDLFTSLASHGVVVKADACAASSSVQTGLLLQPSTVSSNTIKDDESAPANSSSWQKPIIPDALRHPSHGRADETNHSAANLFLQPEPVLENHNPNANLQSATASSSRWREPIIELDEWSPVSHERAAGARDSAASCCGRTEPCDEHTESPFDVLSTGSSDDVIQEFSTDEEEEEEDAPTDVVITNCVKTHSVVPSSSGASTADASQDNESRVSPSPSSSVVEDKAVRLLRNLMERPGEKGKSVRREVERRISKGEGFKLKDTFFPDAVLQKALAQANAREAQAEQLVQMGITSDVEVALRALHDSQGDVNLAATMLLSAGDGR